MFRTHCHCFCKLYKYFFLSFAHLHLELLCKLTTPQDLFSILLDCTSQDILFAEYTLKDLISPGPFLLASHDSGYASQDLSVDEDCGDPEEPLSPPASHAQSVTVPERHSNSDETERVWSFEDDQKPVIVSVVSLASNANECGVPHNTTSSLVIRGIGLASPVDYLVKNF